MKVQNNKNSKKSVVRNNKKPTVKNKKQNINKTPDSIWKELSSKYKSKKTITSSDVAEALDGFDCGLITNKTRDLLEKNEILIAWWYDSDSIALDGALCDDIYEGDTGFKIIPTRIVYEEDNEENLLKLGWTPPPKDFYITGSIPHDDDNFYNITSTASYSKFASCISDPKLLDKHNSIGIAVDIRQFYRKS